MLVRRIIALVVGVAVLAAACGSSGDGGDVEGELLPFALVQANDFTFEADPTDPSRGIFRVRTTEPMICAIVWGETEEFGNFNNSLAMNGTGIIDHDVALPGAEQGETYFFRVQGTTADGGQYRSEVGTFTIPIVEAPADAAGTTAPQGATNIAVGATITEASSVFGAGWEAENAVDDDVSTEWATSGDGDDGFVTIDVGSPQDVVGVEFLTRSMVDGTATTETFTVTVDDGSESGPSPAGNPATPSFTPLEVTGQLFRFDIASSTGGNVGAIEVRIFAR